MLAEIPSYVPDRLPTVPGHEPVGRIVAVGDQVRHHRVGERCLVQTDYRHLPTAASNAAFGYNFEGGLQEYVLLDERMIIEPETGERFLIPVGEEPSASAVALVEPWACVEASYVHRERRGPLPGGRLLVVADAGHPIHGIAMLLEGARPAQLTALMADAAQQRALEATGLVITSVADVSDIVRDEFDDIVYFGADPGRIEALQDCLAPRGLINVVTGGASIGRLIALDVGRVHYDLTRWTGTTSASANEGYAAIPADGEVRPGDRLAVIGAAGPMGLMHVVRAASAGWKDLSILAVDIDDARLERLERAVGPIARSHRVELTIIELSENRTRTGLQLHRADGARAAARRSGGRARRSGMPDQCVRRFRQPHARGRGSRPLHRAALLLPWHERLLIPDMKAVLRKLESGELDTNISLDAVAGFEGVADALAAVESRTAEGKIMVYPASARPWTRAPF